MWARIAVILAALILTSLGGSLKANAGSATSGVPCPGFGFALSVPADRPAAGVACSAHTTVSSADRLSSVTIHVYGHSALTPAQLQADMHGWAAPLFRAGRPPVFKTIRAGSGSLVTTVDAVVSGSQVQTVLYGEGYGNGRLYIVEGLAGGSPGSKGSGYAQAMIAVVNTLRFTPPSGPAPRTGLGRTTLGAPVSRFKADLGTPSSYTPSYDLYTWRPCSASNREIVDVRFSHGVAFRIALVNCAQANLPNYLSIIGSLLPEDAIPIGFASSPTFGALSLYYSQELHDALPSAMRLDPANLHDCVGRVVAPGTLFVGQATGTIAVGLGGCETYAGTAKGFNAA